MKGKKIIERTRLILLCSCEAFALFTLFLLLYKKEYRGIPVCIGTCAMVFIPALVEKLLRCKVHPMIYGFGELYTVGPMIGVCYHLYYTTTWWDKLLHISGGILFALVGLYLIQYLNRNKVSTLSCALFALCFSITISVCWEFVEFGSDRLLGSDMQKDTILVQLRSEYLEDAPSAVGMIDNIEEVIVNGERIPVKGYIDIGLFDSMTDMFVESAGALIVAVFYLIDRGKHMLFIREQPKNLCRNMTESQGRSC